MHTHRQPDSGLDDSKPAHARFSPVDAARAAFDRLPPRRLPPAGRRVVLGAALLWCRNLAIPTARDVAELAGCSPGTVVGCCGKTFEDVFAELIGREWRLLEHKWATSSRDAAVAWLASHGQQLSLIDAAMLRLPSLVHAAVTEAGVAGIGRPPLPLYALASLADRGGPLLSEAAIARVLRSLSVDRIPIGRDAA